MIDTHCHLTYDGLIERVGEVVADAAAAGVDGMICVGTTPDDVARALELADRFPSVYASAGLHPHYAAAGAGRAELGDLFLRAAQHPKLAAVGEMGLDAHYPDPPMDAQRRVLEWQLDLVRELDKPIIIHSRETIDELVRVIRGSGIAGSRFVFHCFTGTQAEMEAVLNLGAMVGFTGIVTFKNARSLAECARVIPLERLLIETDSPYLTPEPYRKVRPNEPRYVADTARFLAALRGMDLPGFVAAVDANARRVFRLPAVSAPA